MTTSKDILWTWLFPDEPRRFDRAGWVRSGGKWIVFDDRKAIETLAEKLAPFIESGEIESAKYRNGDPSAINVYSLDDYALGKNLLRPLTFTYSWFSKFRTILASYGLAGSMRLLKKVLAQRREA